MQNTFSTTFFNGKITAFFLSLRKQAWHEGEQEMDNKPRLSVDQESSFCLVYGQDFPLLLGPDICYQN